MFLNFVYYHFKPIKNCLFTSILFCSTIIIRWEGESKYTAERGATYIKTVELNKLKAEIERVREKLHDLIEQKGSNLMDNEILYLSQLLDKLICEYHNAK